MKLSIKSDVVLCAKINGPIDHFATSLKVGMIDDYDVGLSQRRAFIMSVRMRPEYVYAQQ